MTATQGFLQTLLKAISVWTPVSVRYRAGVRNSGVSVRRGSTVQACHSPLENIWKYSAVEAYLKSLWSLQLEA